MYYFKLTLNSRLHVVFEELLLPTLNNNFESIFQLFWSVPWLTIFRATTELWGCRRWFSSTCCPDDLFSNLVLTKGHALSHYLLFKRGFRSATIFIGRISRGDQSGCLDWILASCSKFKSYWMVWRMWQCLRFCSSHKGGVSTADVMLRVPEGLRGLLWVVLDTCQLWGA